MTSAGRTDDWRRRTIRTRPAKPPSRGSSRSSRRTSSSPVRRRGAGPEAAPGERRRRRRRRTSPGRPIRTAPAPPDGPTAGDRGPDRRASPDRARRMERARPMARAPPARRRRPARPGLVAPPADDGHRTRRRRTRPRMTPPTRSRSSPAGAAPPGTAPRAGRTGRSTRRSTRTHANMGPSTSGAHDVARPARSLTTGPTRFVPTPQRRRRHRPGLTRGRAAHRPTSRPAAAMDPEPPLDGQPERRRLPQPLLPPPRRPDPQAGRTRRRRPIEQHPARAEASRRRDRHGPGSRSHRPVDRSAGPSCASRRRRPAGSRWRSSPGRRSACWRRPRSARRPAAGGSPPRAASCRRPGRGSWRSAILILLIALPRVAAWAAHGTIAAVLVGIPAAILLSAAGGAHEQEASASVLLGLIGLAWVAGIVYAILVPRLGRSDAAYHDP